MKFEKEMFMSKMKKELTLEEIKETELNLLVQFHDICQKNGLRYSLGGGTLLGAVRHKGFIPWDDDIDVMMPRPDYEKFLKYCINNTTPFKLHYYKYSSNYVLIDAKISDPSTILVDKVLSSKRNKVGVFIDVFVIDGLGDNEQAAKKQFMKTSVKREVLNAMTWDKFFRSKTHPLYYEPLRFVVYILSRIANAQKLLSSIDRINREVNFDSSKYAGCVSGVYRTKEIMKTSVFKSYVKLKFEDQEFWCIKDYDSYLKQHYGDYMELPPEEKRQTHHTFKAYRVKG